MGPLSDLLSSSDVQCQVCAAGALYNIMYPSISKDRHKLASFQALLTDTLVLGMVRSCFEDEEKGLRPCNGSEGGVSCSEGRGARVRPSSD